MCFCKDFTESELCCSSANLYARDFASSAAQEVLNSKAKTYQVL